MLALKTLMVLLPALLLGAYCRMCHPQQSQTHDASPHQWSLRPIESSEFFRALPDGPLAEARGGFLLEYERAERGLRVKASRGREMATGRIRWAFGAGSQGVTPVVQIGDSYVEHRISYYPAQKKFDLTMGHAPGISETALEALGKPQQPETIRKCFGCHTTDLQETASGFTFQQGVQCIRCHPEAEAHSKLGIPPEPAAKMTQEASVARCAGCHRFAPEMSASDPWNVRYQPYGLVRSACYQRGGVTCLTCHDPHAAAVRDPGYYNTKCTSCHAAQAAKGDCVRCHMPKSQPHPYLTFSDHFIR